MSRVSLSGAPALYIPIPSSPQTSLSFHPTENMPGGEPASSRHTFGAVRHSEQRRLHQKPYPVPAATDWTPTRVKSEWTMSYSSKRRGNLEGQRIHGQRQGGIVRAVSDWPIDYTVDSRNGSQTHRESGRHGSRRPALGGFQASDLRPASRNVDFSAQIPPEPHERPDFSSILAPAREKDVILTVGRLFPRPGSLTSEELANYDMSQHSKFFPSLCS
jgi:hypothetical protein